MKIIDVKYFPIVAGWYCDDKEALEQGLVKSEYYLMTGNPITQGFKKVREVGTGIGVSIKLENQRVYYGDGTSVTYAGAAGRDQLFRYEDYADYCKSVVNKLLLNKDTKDFVDICSEIENPDNLLGSHTAIRYAVSSALLESSAAVSNTTKASFICKQFNLPKINKTIKYMIQGGSDWYNSVDKAIYHRVDALPHALLHSIEDDFGPQGQILLEYAKWIKQRIVDHKVEPEYNPIFHFDCYGTIGRAFSNDVEKITDYVISLENTIKPFQLQLESPIEMNSKKEQIQIFADLRQSLRIKSSETLIVADEWCNSLNDISNFIESEAVDMVQIKMPDLGSITQSIKAVVTCHNKGVKAYLGGSCNETELNAKNAIHVALATGAEQILVRPGMGIDEGYSIMKNEETRTLLDFQ